MWSSHPPRHLGFNGSTERSHNQCLALISDAMQTLDSAKSRFTSEDVPGLTVFIGRSTATGGGCLSRWVALSTVVAGGNEDVDVSRRKDMAHSAQISGILFKPKMEKRWHGKSYFSCPSPKFTSQRGCPSAPANLGCLRAKR